MNSATGTKKTVGFGKALVVFICVFVLILCGINVLGTSAHIPLVIATIVATIAGVSSGFTWDEMEKGMSETIKASAPLSSSCSSSVWSSAPGCSAASSPQ